MMEPIKPLTRAMIGLLRECCEREMLLKPPCDALCAHSRGLIQRSLVTVRPFYNAKGKKIISIFLNDDGRMYLKSFQR